MKLLGICFLTQIRSSAFKSMLSRQSKYTCNITTLSSI
jgi:hypothetical protein